jgi:CelD/BcsL family acetyltransferase involved in cellulose biosynthesis
LASLAPEWNALLERSLSNTLFLTHAWVTTWWRVFGRNHRLVVLVAREGRDLVGVAPFMVGPGRGRLARPVRHLMFVGQHEEVYPEYLDFFVEPGRESEIAGALAERLLERHQRLFDVVHLEHVLADAVCAPVWRAAFARAGIDLVRTNETPCPSVQLPSTFEAYMAGRSGHFRRLVSYYERRLRKEAPIRYLFAPKEIPVDRALDEVIRLNRDRWGEEGRSFRTRAIIEFHERIAPILVEKGEALLMLMTMADRVVAGRYDFVYGGKVWGYQGGWLREYENWRLGTILLARVIHWSIERGLSEYDFLGGGETYKEQWSTVTKEMADHVGYRRTSLAGQAWRVAMRGRAELKTRLTPEHLGKLRAFRKKLGL